MLKTWSDLLWCPHQTGSEENVNLFLSFTTWRGKHKAAGISLLIFDSIAATGSTSPFRHQTFLLSISKLQTGSRSWPGCPPSGPSSRVTKCTSQPKVWLFSKNTEHHRLRLNVGPGNLLCLRTKLETSNSVSLYRRLRSSLPQIEATVFCPLLVESGGFIQHWCWSPFYHGALTVNRLTSTVMHLRPRPRPLPLLASKLGWPGSGEVLEGRAEQVASKMQSFCLCC